MPVSMQFAGALSSSPKVVAGAHLPHRGSFGDADHHAGSMSASAPVAIPSGSSVGRRTSVTAMASSFGTPKSAAGAKSHGKSIGSLGSVAESFSKGARKSSLSASLSNKRHSGLEDRVGTGSSLSRSAQQQLVAPVRPTVGFRKDGEEKNGAKGAKVNALTKPLLNSSGMGEPALFGKETNVVGGKKTPSYSSSPKGSPGKPSLLTAALTGHPTKPSEAGTSPPAPALPLDDDCSGFVHFDAEQALVQEKRLAESLVDRHEIFGAPLVKLAFELARCAHAGQLRRNGQSCLGHLVEVAEVLANLGLDEKTVAAGLLHEVLDSTMMTLQQLREYVPSEIVDMIVGVTRMNQASEMNQVAHRGGEEEEGLGSKKNMATETEGFRNMLISMSDVRVVLIKLADVLHKMRTLNSLAPRHQKAMAREALQIFVPLANRLGVWSVKAELEDLCFMYLDNSSYLKMQNNMNNAFMREQRARLQKNLDLLQETFKGEGGLEYRDMNGRPKNIYGIHKKMEKKGVPFEKVYDLCACRIIVGSKQDCYKALELVHSVFKPMEGKLKDYIRSPKANGYESLHTVVVDDEGRPFEVQIRTAEMHFINEFGMAAHWQYKERGAPSSSQSGRDKKKSNKKLAQQVAWNRWLLTWHMELQDRKCRPSGSPGQEKDSLAPNFPMDEPLAPPADAEYDPMYVLVSCEGAISVQEVPANCTLAELSQSLEPSRGEGGAGKGEVAGQFLVNCEYHNTVDYTLRMGDLVEVVKEDYFEEEFEGVDGLTYDQLSESEDEGPVVDLFDFERQKLSKMYKSSSSSSSSKWENQVVRAR